MVAVLTRYRFNVYGGWQEISKQGPNLYTGFIQRDASQPLVTNISAVPNEKSDMPLHGRSPDDGRWISLQGGPEKVHLYSAFYDDRPRLEGNDVIRVLSMVSSRQRVKATDIDFRCFVACSSGGDITVQNAVETFAIEMPKHLNIGEDIILFRFVVSCRPECKVPRTVSLGLRNWKLVQEFQEENSIPVEYPEKAQELSPLVTCLPLSYGTFDPNALVEWLEYNRLVGVCRVVVYNDSLSPETIKVLAHYEKEGFVEIRNCWSWISNHPRLDRQKEIDGRSAIAITDCMYRNMYRARHIPVTDLDDVILPLQDRTIMDMIERVNRVCGIDSERVNDYRFKHAEFLVDPIFEDLSDASMPPRSVLLRHRYMLTPVSYLNRTNYHTKSIVNPLGCIAMHNHVCHGYFPTTKGNPTHSTTRRVDPTIALDGHFRTRLCPPHARRSPKAGNEP